MNNYVTQDNLREKQIIEYCRLLDNAGSRIGNDAHLDGHPFEIKSVTKRKGVSTARQVHLKKIQKWRSQYWIIARGPKRPDGMKIEELYWAHPHDLEPFFAQCEEKIRARLQRCDEVLDVAANYCTEAQIEEIQAVVEIGTRLDDPNIPWKLVEASTRLPVRNSWAAHFIIKKKVSERPLRPLSWTAPSLNTCLSPWSCSEWSFS